MISAPPSTQTANDVLSDSREDSRTPTQLLLAFVANRDQQAFESLLRLYGAMVYGVCRRIMGNHHDAEDAFQATFLTLAQKAPSIACPEGIAVWLHQVAYRVSLKAKLKIADRRKKEVPMTEICEPAVIEPNRWRELEPILDGELNRLPEKYRLPLILCDMTGQSRADVAKQLGCPEGTVASRLYRAREILAARLTRRGIVVTSVSLAVLLTHNAASAAVPAALFLSTAAAVSTATVVKTTLLGTTFSKVLAFVKSAFHSLAYGKVALVGATGTGLLAAGLALQHSEENSQRGAPPKLAKPFDEIAATYRRNYETFNSFKSLRIEYVVRQGQSLIDDPDLYLKLNDHPMPEKGKSSFVSAYVSIIDGQKVMGKGMHYNEKFDAFESYVRKKYPDRWEPVKSVNLDAAYEDWLKEFPNVPVLTNFGIAVFDGKRFRKGDYGADFSVRRDDEVYFWISAPETTNWRYCRDFFLDFMFSGMIDSRIPGQHEFGVHRRLPDILEMGSWRVVSKHESLNGADCLVIEKSPSKTHDDSSPQRTKNWNWPKGLKLWLDREKGFAVRGIGGCSETRPGTQCVEFRHITGDIYVPQKILWHTGFVPEDSPSEHRGKPTSLQSWELMNLEINQPVDEKVFRVVPPVGTNVVDETGEPLDVDGHRIDIRGIAGLGYPAGRVEYRQPADSKEIPAAIKKRLAEFDSVNGQSLDNPTGQRGPMDYANPNRLAMEKQTVRVVSTSFRWIIVGNAVLLFLAGSYFLWKRRSA